jgi:hypothetical protein
MLRKKLNKMIVFWIFVILVGTVLTIFGSLKLNDEWSKNEDEKHIHTVPDLLLLDFEIEAELDEKLKNEILKTILPKIHGQDKTDFVFLLPFFDQVGYETSEIKKKNYALTQNIYNNFLNFDIFGSATSKDQSIHLRLTKSNSVINLSAEKIRNESYLQILDYNSKSNRVRIQFKNITLDVNSTSRSQFILDLNEGQLYLNLTSKFQVKKIIDVFLKTRKITYFFIPELKEGDFGSFNGKLGLII